MHINQNNYQNTFPLLWQLNKLQINKNIWRQSTALSITFKMEPIHCIFYRNVVKLALFAIKNGGFQTDIIDILDIITLL